MTPWIWGSLLWGCSETPVALPPSALPPPAPHAEMVTKGAVTGFMVRPNASTDATGQATLLLADNPHNSVARQEATELALQGDLCLIIDETKNHSAAADYLINLDAIQSVRTLCSKAAEQCAAGQTSELHPAHAKDH